jgi:hypothetical protein
MHTIFVTLVISCMPVVTTIASILTEGDSTEKTTRSRNVNMEVTARMHSAGMLGYAGLIASHDPCADITFKLHRKNAGIFIVKSADLYDLHSNYNFALAMIYYDLHFGNQLTLTPQIGTAFDQRRTFADRGSDAMGFLTTRIKLSNHLVIDQTARFSNLFVHPEYFDWLNRFRIIYNKEHLGVTTMLFSNNSVFDTNSYNSFGITVAWNRIKVASHAYLSTSITGLVVAKSTDKELSKTCDGLMFTVAVSSM